MGAGVFLRFPGQWEEGAWGEAGTGIYYNVHRWYEEQTGRYESADPALNERPSDLDPYAYVGSNPLKLTDPDGRLPCSPLEQNSCRQGCKARGKIFTMCTAFELKIPCTPLSYRFIKCDCKVNLCAPCPPGGPSPNTRIDTVPPSAPHFPCPGDHWHFRVYNQDPVTCKCYPSSWLFGGCF